MKAEMQDRMLVEASLRESSQRQQFTSFLSHMKATETSNNQMQGRAIDAQLEFFFRQDLRGAFTAFENPTLIQGQMFSDLVALRPGVAAQPMQRFGPERRVEQPLALPPNATVLAIDNGSCCFIALQRIAFNNTQPAQVLEPASPRS